jgi:hypothetical protein
MKFKVWILGAVGPLVLAGMATTGQAASITTSTRSVAASAKSTLVDKVASPHCWRHNGARHCSWYGAPRLRYRNGDSDYYEHDSSSLPFGSQRWWDQMLRENRLNPGGGRG